MSFFEVLQFYTSKLFKFIFSEKRSEKLPFQKSDKDCSYKSVEIREEPKGLRVHETQGRIQITNGSCRTADVIILKVKATKNHL